MYINGDQGVWNTGHRDHPRSYYKAEGSIVSDHDGIGYQFNRGACCSTRATDDTPYWRQTFEENRSL